MVKVFEEGRMSSKYIKFEVVSVLTDDAKLASASEIWRFLVKENDWLYLISPFLVFLVFICRKSSIEDIISFTTFQISAVLCLFVQRREV